MILSKKVRLLPSELQQQKLFESANTARWAYNFALDLKLTHYQLYKENYKESDIRKAITELKTYDDYKWLKNVSAKIPQQAVKDCDMAFQRFFKGLAQKPRFKSKKKSKLSFYSRCDKTKAKDNCLVNIEKVGWVKTSEQLPIDIQFSNPRISYDGKYWYISVGIETELYDEELTDISLGIDLGIKDLAICSNGSVYRNINKDRTIRKLKKKLKRLQRQVSKKYELNKKGGRCCKTNNIIKLESQIKLIHRRISNIRKNHLHQTTTAIVRTKPYRIVIEDLNVSGMMKNKHLSKAVQEQCFYEFRRQLEYKCKLYGIELVIANRFYPSSKTCSNCGHIKSDLKLSDRTYICTECGFRLDRDLNASINLSKYES